MLLATDLWSVIGGWMLVGVVIVAILVWCRDEDDVEPLTPEEIKAAEIAVLKGQIAAARERLDWLENNR